MALYRDRGVVLRTHKFGEADRVVVIVTENHGKVRAVAKGVRRTRSRFGARLEPTRHLSLQLYGGRNLDTVTQVESIDHFRAIREDIDRLGVAMTMLEAVDQTAQDGGGAPGLYRMLVGGLRTLEESPAPLLLPAFLLKLLAHEGFSPELDRCVVGGEEGPLVSFDTRRGGVVCAVHRGGRPVTPEAVNIMRATLGGGLRTVLEVPESDVTREVSSLVARLYEMHVERRLRSAHLLDGG